MHLIIYIFKFSAQSIHMVLRYSQMCYYWHYYLYCNPRTKTVLITSLFRNIIQKQFITFHIIYIFKFLAQSIHMVLRYSHFCVIINAVKAFRTQNKDFIRTVLKNHLKEFFRFLIIHLMLCILLFIDSNFQSNRFTWS